MRQAGLHDVDDWVVEQVIPLVIEKQSTEPFMAKVAVSSRNFGQVPKVYIRTTLDRVTTPALQDRMIANWPVEKVYDLEAGHFPALSVPAKLADILHLSASDIGEDRKSA